MNVHKRTTQVNIWMAIGVGIFFVAAALVVTWYQQNRPVSAPVPPERRAAP
jgi:hypothetical protein